MAKAVPGKKYVKITVKDTKSGALKRVTMESSKAAALRKLAKAGNDPKVERDRQRVGSRQAIIELQHTA